MLCLWEEIIVDSWTTHNILMTQVLNLLSHKTTLTIFGCSFVDSDLPWQAKCFSSSHHRNQIWFVFPTVKKNNYYQSFPINCWLWICGWMMMRWVCIRARRVFRPLWPVYNRSITFSKVKKCQNSWSPDVTSGYVNTQLLKRNYSLVKSNQHYKISFSARNKNYFSEQSWRQTMRQSLGNWGCFFFLSKQVLFSIITTPGMKNVFPEPLSLHTLSSHFTCW